MRRMVAGGLALGVMTTLAACGGDDAGVDPGGDPARVGVPLEETRYEEAVDATNALGLELMLAQGGGDNAIVSPASLAIALAMLGEGTEGEGEAELTEILGLPHADRTEAYGALNTALGAHEDGEFSADDLPDVPFLRVANRAVVHEGYVVKTDFVDGVRDYFGATVESTDLTSQVGKDVLDAWVDEKTEGLIERSAIEPDPDLRLVLQNALLFAARWEAPFHGGLTYEREFTLADGTIVQAEMMSRRGEVSYGEAGGYAAIELPYTSDFVAYFVLPPQGDDPTAEGIYAAIGALEDSADTQIAIPKLDLAVKTDVKEHLAGTGVTAMFSDPTALHGVADDGLVVSDIAQQARLIVAEEGTVGAAVTEVGASILSTPLQSFSADRPFVLIVRHEATGIDLFTAYIADPTSD